MPSLNRVVLVKLHLVVAAFILPVALMFFITGALYTWGIKGGFSNTKYFVLLNQPVQKDKEWLSELAIHELAQREIELPTGKSKIKAVGNSFYFEWSGSYVNVILAPTANPFKLKLIIKEAQLHRFFVQLHKAKGGVAFKVYAAIVSVCLLFLFISGVILAWQMKRYRKLLLGSISSGVLVFVVLANIS